MISVIIPVFNVEEYLHDCINSVLKQSYQDFEIICIDDNSTDSSSEILEYFSKKDSRVKVYKNPLNKGQGYSRNKGLNMSQGKYVFFLDGDDWISFDTFEQLVKMAENKNLEVLMFKNIVYYENSQDFDMEQYYEMDFLIKCHSKVFNHWDIDKTQIFSIPNGPCNKLYLKSFLDKYNIRFPNKNLINEDNPFFYKLLLYANRISFFDKYFYNRRRRPSSIMTLTNERLFESIEIVYEILEIFLENKAIYEHYKKEVITYIFNMLNIKYEQIDTEFKDEFFKEIQNVFCKFINYYGLFDDLNEFMESNLRNKFNFDDMIKNFEKNTL